MQAALQTAAAPHGLRFGPDPSTHNRCTIGGMIGNNACGSRALGYGRTSDNVVGLDVVTGGGDRLPLGARTHDRLADPRRLDRWSCGELATIRTEFGRFGRQVSGYSLEHLLPERGFDVARSWSAPRARSPRARRPSGWSSDPPTVRCRARLPDMADAADAVPALLPLGPTARRGPGRPHRRRRARRTAARRCPTCPAARAG